MKNRAWRLVSAVTIATMAALLVQGSVQHQQEVKLRSSGPEFRVEPIEEFRFK